MEPSLLASAPSLLQLVFVFIVRVQNSSDKPGPTPPTDLSPRYLKAPLRAEKKKSIAQSEIPSSSRRFLENSSAGRSSWYCHLLLRPPTAISPCLGLLPPSPPPSDGHLPLPPSRWFLEHSYSRRSSWFLDLAPSSSAVQRPFPASSGLRRTPHPPPPAVAHLPRGHFLVLGPRPPAPAVVLRLLLPLPTSPPLPFLGPPPSSWYSISPILPLFFDSIVARSLFILSPSLFFLCSWTL